MKNISSTIKDLKPNTDVFEKNGRFVKVRLTKTTPPPGSPSFGVLFVVLSASETDKKGKAIVQGDGWRLMPGEVQTIQSDASVDVTEIINGLKEEAVDKVIQAAELQDQFDKI